MKRSLYFSAMLLAVGLWASEEAGLRNNHTVDLDAVARVRAEHGVRSVALDWVLLRNDGECVVWGYASSQGGGHAKQVKMRLGGPLWEEEYYQTGLSFPSSDGDATSYEQLTLHYDYGSKLCAVRVVTDNPALSQKLSGVVEEKGLPLKDAHVLAETILSTWNLKR